MVDLACMRDAMNRLGGDSNKINPLVCVLPDYLDANFFLCCKMIGFVTIYPRFVEKPFCFMMHIGFSFAIWLFPYLAFTFSKE